MDRAGSPICAADLRTTPADRNRRGGSACGMVVCPRYVGCERDGRLPAEARRVSGTAQAHRAGAAGERALHAADTGTEKQSDCDRKRGARTVGIRQARRVRLRAPGRQASASRESFSQEVVLPATSGMHLRSITFPLSADTCGVSLWYISSVSLQRPTKGSAV